jgi:adenine phosphoribosyltransferase
MDLKTYIREIQDFPVKGVLFRDITPLLKNPEAFRQSIDTLTGKYRAQGLTKIVSIESRGYIFGGCLAYHLGAGFVPVRKPGKLPADKVSLEYSLEYGTGVLEIHRDAIEQGDKVLIFDDVLATGGTALAVCKLVEKLGAGVTGCGFLINLTYLGGRDKLKDYSVYSLIEY